MNKTIYSHGTILTLSDHHGEAIYVEDGHIQAVGSLEEIKAYDKGDVTWVDLNGKTLMPSFIDPHSHFTAYAYSLLQVDVSECDSFEAIITKIKEYLVSNDVPKGQWISAKGYDQNNLKEKAHPTADILDQATNEHPIHLQHVSGHVGVFNHLGLKELGIDESTPQIEGGKIDVKTGYLEEKAYVYYQQKVPMESVDKIFKAMLQAQERYASYGITTCQEGFLMDALAKLLMAFTNQDLLKLDLVGYIDYQDRKHLKEELHDYLIDYYHHLKVGGYKLFLDGSPQARTAWIREPYEGESSYRGYPTMSDEALLEALKNIVQDHRQVLVHCNGDGAIDQYLRMYEKVYDHQDLRPVIVHAQLMGLDQLDKVKALKMIPSYFVAHVYHWGDIHLQNFGEKRASHISPVKATLDLNIPFTFHQDAPVIEPNMFETIWCAVNRQTKKGVILGKDQCIDVLDAIRAVTINAAYQYHEENEKGTLEVGKKADMIIVDQNPLIVDPYQLRDIQVLETIKDGETIYKR